MSRLISRDPFARETLYRDTERAFSRTCEWCGQVRKNGRLYRYVTHTDDGRVHDHRGLFCSKSCHDSYRT